MKITYMKTMQQWGAILALAWRCLDLLFEDGGADVNAQWGGFYPIV